MDAKYTVLESAQATKPLKPIFPTHRLHSLSRLPSEK